MSTHSKWRKAVPWLVRGLLTIVAIAGWALYLWENYSYQQSPPWYGRGGHLAPLPYTIIVGPVVIGRGLPRVVELGQEKGVLEKRLAKPLIPELDTIEMERKHITDATGAFYDGVFAWVFTGGEPERVYAIRYDLSSFHHRFGGHLIIALADSKGKVVLLREGMEQSALEQDLRGIGILPQYSANEIVIEDIGSKTFFDFDEQNRLKGIELILTR